MQQLALDLPEPLPAFIPPPHPLARCAETENPVQRLRMLAAMKAMENELLRKPKYIHITYEAIKQDLS